MILTIMIKGMKSCYFHHSPANVYTMSVLQITQPISKLISAVKTCLMYILRCKMYTCTVHSAYGVSICFLSVPTSSVTAFANQFNKRVEDFVSMILLALCFSFELLLYL